MKFFIPIFIILLFIPQAFSKSTESSKFAEKHYAEINKIRKVHINVKKEYKQPCQKIIENFNSTYIVYGWGDMKIKKRRKFRVSYMTINDCNNKPLWSSVKSDQ